MEVLSKIRFEKLRVENQIYIQTAGRVTEALSTAIVQDARGTAVENPKETFEKLQMQIHAEQKQWDAIGLDMSVKHLVKHYKVCLANAKLTAQQKLAKEGWGKVRPSISTTIRITFLLVFP